MAQLFNIHRVVVGPKNLEATVELAEDAPLMTSDDLEGTARVLDLLPQLAGHLCLGDASSQFGDVVENTELAHLLEHVTVELLAQTDIAGDISTGQTTQVGERAYQITLACPDDVLVTGALSSAAWILQWAYTGGGEPEPDVEATVEGLVQLVQSLNAAQDDEPSDDALDSESNTADEGVSVADGYSYQPDTYDEDVNYSNDYSNEEELSGQPAESDEYEEENADVEGVDKDEPSDELTPSQEPDADEAPEEPGNEEQGNDQPNSRQASWDFGEDVPRPHLVR